MHRSQSYRVAPSAARLTESLRDIGYDFQTAVADLVDNSLSAAATRINIETEFIPDDSYVLIHDDGVGMTQEQLVEALRFGTRRAYEQDELGRFGLGLKTGSLSQCRRLTVVSRHSPKRPVINVMTLDLNRIAKYDEWDVTVNEASPAIERARAKLAEGPGTVVVWEDLDRVLPDRYAQSGWGRRRLSSLATRTSDHLAMVFHRFLEGAVPGRPETVIAVNGEKLRPWDPFARAERHTRVFPPQVFEVETPSSSFDVRFQGFVLPVRGSFSTADEFESNR